MHCALGAGVKLDHPRWRLIADPQQCSIVVVAVLPAMAAVAFASLVWSPLGYVMALYCIYSFKTVLDGTRRMYVVLASERSKIAVAKMLAAITVAGFVASTPVSAAFLRGDLDAMAAPATASAQSGVDNPLGELPVAIYGQSNGWPSYGACQFAQNYIGIDATHICYSGVGYLRLWQMPVALTTLISISLLYALFPLTVAWHIRTHPQRRTPSVSRFSKETP